MLIIEFFLLDSVQSDSGLSTRNLLLKNNLIKPYLARNCFKPLIKIDIFQLSCRIRV